MSHFWGQLHNDTERQVVVRGTLGDIPATDYRVCYRVSLRDGAQTVYLDIPRELITLRKVETGDYIQVTGILSVDSGQRQSSRVDIRLAVSDLERADRPQELEREERATLDFLRSLGQIKSHFPSLDHIKLSLIHPVAEQSRVHEDFQRQLAQVTHLLELELIRVSMNGGENIASGIERATGNVLVLIRGGGDSADFEVFDQKCVIEAWAAKRTFKVLGLGHEGTGGTLLDFISDYVGSTPTAVGAFLAQRISTMAQRRQRFEALSARCKTLEENNNTLKADLTRASELRGAEVHRMREASRRQKPMLLLASAFIAGLLFVLGVIVGQRWGH